LFKQGDLNKTFYGIISGKISIRIMIKDESGDVKNNSNKDVQYINIPSSVNTPTASNNNHITFNTTAGGSTPANQNNKFLSLNYVGRGSSNIAIPNSDRSKLARMKSEPAIQENMKEEVLAVFTGGNCFGQYAVAYDIPRTASAYSIEDTHLFYLDKSYFEISFQKDIVKADQDRKHFLINRLPILENITKIDDYITRIVPIVKIS
jgi:CRP-like cAMP-binding protein